MKVPLQWLKEYIKVGLVPEALADKLTMAGLEVGAIEYHGRSISDVVVGKVKAAERHATKPDIMICQVDTGIKILQIVTKAGNVKVGDKVPVAVHGATLPSGIKIQNRELHGVESFGMLCSKVELGLSDTAEGIFILEKDAAVGEDIRKVLGIGGAVLDIDVLPNRIDVLSIIGVAREVGAILNKKAKFPLIKVRESSEGIKKSAKISVKDKGLCPRYMARVIKNVSIKPSPQWMQERLIACGMRPINNVVDITNYVLLEMGQPLHAFDLNSLKDGTLIVRKAAKGEKMTTIDGEKRELGECLVIADAQKAIAVAGVMGGMSTEVIDSTKDILLESAYFDPKTIHKAEKYLKLRTESSIRFARGVDWNGVEAALDRAADLMGELAGGKISAGKVDIKAKDRKPKKVALRLKRVNDILGTDLKFTEISSILSRLGFKVKGSNVEVPLFRAGDIEREIDIIEEIARIHGYEKIPVTNPDLKIKNTKGVSEDQIKRIKTILIDAGLNEVLTYSMLPPKEADIGEKRGQSIRILNPISDDLSVMRPSILPGLLKVLTFNLNRQVEDVNIFEAGKIFYKDDKGVITEKAELGAVLYGKRSYRYDGKKENMDFFQIKGIIEDILGYLGVSYEIKENAFPGYHPSRSAAIHKTEKTIGVFGELHPDIGRKLEIEGPIYVISLDLDETLNIKKLPPKYKEIPLYPAVKRDIAMIVPYGVSNKAIIGEIRASGGELIEGIALFDKYEGNQIEKGYYSLAYSVTYRKANRTLTDEEVNAKHEEISLNLAKKLGVKIRK
ncbi:MAG: phenylalanine--tRNA ligase subunit beta [bacterium]